MFLPHNDPEAFKTFKNTTGRIFVIKNQGEVDDILISSVIEILFASKYNPFASGHQESVSRGAGDHGGPGGVRGQDSRVRRSLLENLRGYAHAYARSEKTTTITLLYSVLSTNLEREV